ncbi:MAG: hypothetical protein AAF800_00885 [Planctomycetota bacterium]
MASPPEVNTTLAPVWIVAFVGHRPSAETGRSREELAACAEPLKEALRSLNTAAREAGGRVELLTSAAAGSDLEAADAAEALGLAVHVILPKPEDAFGEDFTGPSAEDWPRARRRIAAARAGAGHGSLRIAAGDNTAPDCYHEANTQMLKVSDVLLTVYNGRPSDQPGGTSDAVAQAEALGRPVFRIDPADAGRVYRPDDPMAWTRIDADNQKLFTDVQKGPPDAAPGSAPAEAGGTAGVLDALDRRATHTATRFRGRLIWSVRLHLASALIAAVSATLGPFLVGDKTGKSHGVADVPHLYFGPLQAFTSVEFVLVMIALGLTVRAHFGHFHHDWRRVRLAAEITRGIHATRGMLDPLEPLILRHAPTWRRFAVSVSVLAGRDAPRGDPPARSDRYQDERVEPQMAYFRREHAKSRPRANWLGRVSAVATLAAPPCILLALVLKLFYKPFVADDWFAAMVANGLPVILPLVAAFATALMVAGDHARRAERYEQMIGRLEQSTRLLETLKTDGAVSRTIADIEELLLDELIEWYAASNYTGE